MTTSWKCAECGLVNFASENNCKRCGAVAVTAGVEAPPPPTGIVLEDGYILPPPPAIGGIWRDKSTLVMTKDASLPDRCVKCNRPANGLRLKRKLSWHHPILYLLVFGAAILYVILAIALSKRATVYFGICTEHVQRRRKLMSIGGMLLAAGVIMPVVAFAYDYPMLGLLGIGLFLFAIVWAVLAARVVSLKKIDDQFVWLTGINDQFLMQFPPLPRGP